MGVMMVRLRKRLCKAAMLVLGGLAMVPVQAEEPLALRNSFPVGTSGVVCTALNSSLDPRLGSMFDRAYRLTCRDAASAVGTLLLREAAADGATGGSVMMQAEVTCASPRDDLLAGVGRVQRRDCRDPGSRLDYRQYSLRKGRKTYVAEGLSGYDPVLRLALANLVTGRIVAGEVRVASTEVSDPAAFARVQAGLLEAGDALDEAYARNVSGQFSEASEFFTQMAQRDRSQAGRRAEALANAGLQQSNLGNHASARRLLGEAAVALPRNDVVLQRLLRNFRAMEAMNRADFQAALRELAAVMEAGEDGQGAEALERGEISSILAERINRESGYRQALGSLDPRSDTGERIMLLDVQALLLRASAHRRLGEIGQSRRLLDEVIAGLGRIRDGKLGSMAWLRADLAFEEAMVRESEGQLPEAQARFEEGVALTEQTLPGSPALLLARAQLASFLLRTGREREARSMFAELVATGTQVPDGATVLRDVLPPYLDLLAREADGEAAAALVDAAQLLQRPGLARTQAILSRELSEGADEASALFRLSVVRSREIARAEAEVQKLAASRDADMARLASLRSGLQAMQVEQTALLARLADYPRYKIIAARTARLDELQASLGDDEAYFKLLVAGGNVQALFITRRAARAFRLAVSADALADAVSVVRSSTVEVINGQAVVYPFDVEASHSLYRLLLGPVEDQLGSVRHVIFEPDGALLQLPLELLVTQASSIETYRGRVARPDGDEFDMRSIAWLGRQMATSVSVSPRSFLESRRLTPSDAPRAYLGLGRNAPADPGRTLGDGTGCSWPAATWSNPISGAELLHARDRIGAAGGEVRMDLDFSDTALLADPALADFRVIHFATHGLVTPPDPRCPAEPSLVTSFGGSQSDGLLSFREIFDLRLNADLIILSACNTAGEASGEASRAAGLGDDGGYALDGLVRAFVGAGARTVVASHWSVPDDYGATRRLIEGMIAGNPGQSLADSLASARRNLMDDAQTSHPFYWAAFIILGDGAKPVASNPK